MRTSFFDTRQRKMRRRYASSGVTMISLLIWTGLILIVGAAMLSLCTSQTRMVRGDESRAVTSELAEAGAQDLIQYLYDIANRDQNFSTKSSTAGSGTYAFDSDPLATGTPLCVQAGGGSGDTITGNPDLAQMHFRTYVSSKTAYNTDYGRDLVIISTGWLDLEGTNTTAPGPNDPSTTLERHVRITFDQNHVFDYAYFVNNYGWMTGFNQSSLVVNGDMRANGDFNITGGMVNGSVVAAANPNIWNSAKGGWGAYGVANISGDTGDISNGNYLSSMMSQTNGRARQAYNSSTQGSKNPPSLDFLQWKDLIYDNTPDASSTISSGLIYGAVVADSTGSRSMSSPNGSHISTTATSVLPMPDLSNIAYYQNQSATYTDPKQTYLDGTSNTNYNASAYIQVWDSTTGSYKTITGQNGDAIGNISGSTLLAGTADHPILIHGPVTVTGDVAITGYVRGQGTIYTGRNVHVIGSVIYSNPPKFDGSGPHGNSVSGIDQDTEQKSMLALCAAGSVIMGNPKDFSGNPLQYMEPPFTTSRLSDDGSTIIPAFDATASDTAYRTADGKTPMKYQSLLKQSDIDAHSSAVTQIDAVMYTNNCAGGLLGDGTAKGFTINGSVISKDEAMVINLGGGGKMTMNYDSRIKERSISSKPLVDLKLPRIPSVTNLSWREM